MPKGYRSSNLAGLGPSDNTQRLIEAMQDIEARLVAERRKDRGRLALVTFCDKHGLLADDLRRVAKLMSSRKVGSEPVQSKVAAKRKVLPQPKVPAKGKVGKAIRAARTKLGMSAEDVGQRIGLSGATIAAWEIGKRQPGAEYHGALMAALKLPKGVLSNGHAAGAER